MCSPPPLLVVVVHEIYSYLPLIMAESHALCRRGRGTGLTALVDVTSPPLGGMRGSARLGGVRMNIGSAALRGCGHHSSEAVGQLLSCRSWPPGAVETYCPLPRQWLTHPLAVRPVAFRRNSANERAAQLSDHVIPPVSSNLRAQTKRTKSCSSCSSSAKFACWIFLAFFLLEA